MALTPQHFSAGWQLLAAYYGRTVDTPILTLLYRALVRSAPDLTEAQFDYALTRVMGTATFMPTIVELLREVYEPLWRVRRGAGPQLPAVDPTRASEGLLAAYYAAQATRERWKQSREAQAPQPGHFRLDRWQEIPGATLRPWQERELQTQQRLEQGFIQAPDEVIDTLLPPWERRHRRPDADTDADSGSEGPKS